MNDRSHRVAFVKVDAPLQARDRNIADRAEYQSASVSVNGRGNKAGNFVIRKFRFDLYLVDKSAEAGAKYDAHARFVRSSRADVGGRFFQIFLDVQG